MQDLEDVWGYAGGDERALEDLSGDLFTIGRFERQQPDFVTFYSRDAQVFEATV